MVEEKIYVAVSKEVNDSELSLKWAIQNSGGRKICILHVHVPPTMIPVLGGKFPASSLQEPEVEAYRELERQNMHKMLVNYVQYCQQMGVQVEKLHDEMECIEQGIVAQVSKYGIRKLVMGAAHSKNYSRKMIVIRSQKAIYVRDHAEAFCHIQFICKGHLIYTRECSLDAGNAEVVSPLLQQRPNTEVGRSVHSRFQSVTLGQDRWVEAVSPLLQQRPNTEVGRSVHSRSQSVPLGQNRWVKLTNPVQELFRTVRSAKDRRRGSLATVTSPDGTEGLSTPQNRLSTEGSLDKSDSRRSFSFLSKFFHSDEVEATLTPDLITQRDENVLNSSGISLSRANLCHSSPPSVLDGGIDCTPYDQLEQAMGEAEKARHAAYQETVRRGKAEKDAIEAIRRAKAAESLYTEELKRRKEVEEALEKAKEKLGKMKSHRDKVNEELQLALDQKSSLESQNALSELMVKDLEQKIISAVDLLQSYKKERDELQMQRDNALREAEELRRKTAEVSSMHLPQFFLEFSFPEIEEATDNFNPTLKIGEGGYGIIYKGMLRHTPVAIKMLHPNSLQGPSEFQHEVDVLSKLRHPNLVTFMGACQESWTLVYEYLPNGSLEDRLTCKDNTPPLSWQTRICIAAELCSALIFLHSCKPHSVVHGDLKPSNILLDANLVSKLGDFGISRILSHHESSSNNTTAFWRTDPKGTFFYVDPEFLASGELTPKSDIYSFGIILLRLLTGRPAMGIRQEVQSALDAGKLKSLLDPLAGDWPFVQAEQFCRTALRCCNVKRKSRPDLCSDVWRLLEPMRAASGGTNAFRLDLEGLSQPPTYFICPIFQKVMQCPHVAADGFTYEAEAIQGWLDSGRETSPMTNDKLAHHNHVPNHALRSAIQDWLQNH